LGSMGEKKKKRNTRWGGKVQKKKKNTKRGETAKRRGGGKNGDIRGPILPDGDRGPKVAPKNSSTKMQTEGRTI